MFRPKKLPCPPGSHVFQRTRTICELNSHFSEKNVLTKFHEDWTKKKTSRRKLLWWPYINKTNLLTKFYDDWAKVVTSRVFTWKTAPPPGSHVFQWTRTTFELDLHIIKTNILTIIYLGIIGTNLLTINVASRVFTNQIWTDGQMTDKA
ncbi:hypothetical protein DPMN_024997 [Dreissena polymorpha]|uniref:Uncharacterized protein n=1 Tax=Dreissena polymorpha TaxID=45954 RepID=A0A9D4LQ80_DREPO|nr:hypothetical protein DPMN_024997 [Dreissena polymorpha]